MALLDVISNKPDAELRGSILPGGKTHLSDRINHYSFGTQNQEFAVPLGVDVSLYYLASNVMEAARPSSGAQTVIFTRHRVRKSKTLALGN